MIAIPDIEEGWLRARLAFLLSRAQFHMEQPREDYRHVACAATLYRDAACLALLLEEVKVGQELLVRSGDLLLEMGLAAGLPLIAMADSSRAAKALQAYQQMIDEVNSGTETSVDAATVARRSMVAASGRSFRCSLAVVQAEMLSHASSGLRFSEPGPGDAAERRRRARLDLAQRFGGREVGNSGLSVSSYLHVAGAFETRRSGAPGALGEGVSETVELLGRQRAERIAAARRDQFHWRLVLRPDELVDLDIVALMLLAPGDARAQATDWFGTRGEPIIRAPLAVARLLDQAG